MAPVHWHTLTGDEVVRRLATDREHGLSTEEAVARRQQYGSNRLRELSGRSAAEILGEQLTSVMTLLLSAAAAVSWMIGSLRDAAAIFAIVLLFVALGFFQDYRAERAIAALRRLTVPLVKVRRGGTVAEVTATELVPGDVVFLDAGSLVPADCYLLEGHALQVQEALLTGEGAAVPKRAQMETRAELPLAERYNLLYMGTLVAAGRAVAVVIATGMETELGKIATLLQQVKKEWTPLQRRLDRLGRRLALLALAVALLILLLGLLRGESLAAMLLLAVSIAVAAIPEGLPAVVTITLALGAQRMLKRNALIRRLPAVETLGSVTVICSDKTGTLTQNLMTVSELVSSTAILQGGQTADEQLLLLLGTLCNDAAMRVDSGGRSQLLGDPTETALLVAAAAAGMAREELAALLPRTAEIPFDAASKRMITVHTLAGMPPAPLKGFHLHVGMQLAVVKGAIDAVLQLCDRVLTAGGPVPLREKERSMLLATADRLSAAGQRVLALALRYPEYGEGERLESLQQGFVCAGLIALSDPPRKEARDAVRRALAAGIRPVMITGDHPLTAIAIARQVGIADAAGALTGTELDRLAAEELQSAVETVSIYARVSPEHKLRIVEAIQRQGGVAAMTGDGVNDAPALKRADVGVAMGRAGTEVAREAADMVLLDDNFASIVAAVEEGRTIYDNIRKFVIFSVAGNTGKLLTVLLLPLMGLPMPLTPLQLLWLNLLTDGLLGLGMGVERPEPDLMTRPPIAPDSQIFDRHASRYILVAGGTIGGLCIAVTWLVWHAGGPWQSVLFVSLALAQVAQAMALRSFRSSCFSLGLLSNPLLGIMAIAVVLLQGMAVYLPPMRTVFHTEALLPQHLYPALVPAVLVFLVLEGEKWRSRRRSAGSGSG